MISTSQAYKQQLIAGNRNYVIKIPVFLEGNSTQTPDFTLENEQIWEQGIILDSATSNDGSFDIGSAIVGSLKVVINNISGNYSSYDFYNAKLVLWLGVTGDVDENDDQVYYRIGFFVCDTPTYNGSLITLECLDNMTWFDVPFSGITGISYPITAGAFVSAICSYVGVTLGTVTFPNYDVMSISAESGAWLAENDINCREVLQYVAQKCCCYCKIDTAGELNLKWYDKNAIIGLTGYDGGTYNTNTTPYSDGDDVDGGTFDPWNTGDVADGGTFVELQDGAWLTNNYEMQVSTDDIVVTGCRVRNTSGKDEEKYDELWVDATIEQTHDRYVLVIENNPLIIASEAASVANVVGSILAGLPIRAFNSSSLSDFSYETGDMVTIIDFRGNMYHTWITQFTFTTNNSENFACGAESIRQRSETRYSETAKTLAEAGENAKAQLTEYDQAQAAMNELAQEALGYKVYEYDVTGGGHVTWLYDAGTVDDTDPEHPLFPSADTVIMISGDGLFISKDHGAHYYEGLDANSGTAILNMIYAHGINCDWIHAGTLTLGGVDNVNGKCSVLNASGTEVVKLDKDGIYVSQGDITSYRNNDTAYGYTQISGGNCKVLADGSNFFRVDAKGYNSRYVTLGPNIAVSDADASFYVERSLRYLGWAVEDAYTKHGSDKSLKKNIKDIPIQESRDVILCARPRHYEFKETLEGGVRSGFIAQELRKSLDEIGDKSAIERESTRRDNEREVLYEDFIAHLVNTTQDLYSQIDELKAEIADLKARVK